MTSVMAVRHKTWMVFFVGTGDGQLIKLAVDRAFQAVCPKVMYKAHDDRQVFPKMHLDVVDRKHVYVVFRNQMMRVPVSKCETHTSLQACWSAQDPYCSWCSSKQRCTSEDDCPDSLSISDDSHQKKMVSYQVGSGSNGQVTLHVQTHLTVGRPELQSNFACEFSTYSDKLCTITDSPQFPWCICTFSESLFSTEGLNLTVEIRLGRETVKEQLKLLICSGIKGPPTPALCRKCISAGCSWSHEKCSWATAGFVAAGVCKMLETRTDFSMPEIFSIIPSKVSFYGRNNAVMTGCNLGNVTRVRIQAALDCGPQESPVWNNTGMNLTFHIPSADKGLVNVCAVLPDGSCHGNAKITYYSSPSCTDVTPTTTWASGKRMIFIVGFHLQFVEGVIHSHAPQKVNLPTFIYSEEARSLQFLTYDTPPTTNSHETFTSAMYLKIANETLSCSTSITYLPDPEFLSFSSVRTGKDLHVTIQKRSDKLEMTKAELTIWIVHEGTLHLCVVEIIDTDFVICKILGAPSDVIQHLMIQYGYEPVTLYSSSTSVLRLVLLIPSFIGTITFLYCSIYYCPKKKLDRAVASRWE
ncbi:plexin-C1-like [Genypterus blacodes]|uniref:plexin-C1-like n=1 Tax=Genypterus blacodes TaxID=154954 RepID=UPI003F75909B